MTSFFDNMGTAPESDEFTFSSTSDGKMGSMHDAELAKWMLPGWRRSSGARVKQFQSLTHADTNVHSQDAENLSQVIEPLHSIGPRLHALQEWEGYVIEIGENDFGARLVDLTANALQESEEATIPRAELSADDDIKMHIGSIFRWVIGYEYSEYGTKKRVSQIVFRDLPAVTEMDIRDGEAWAQRMSLFLDR